jgi:hypothetical protein
MKTIHVLNGDALLEKLAPLKLKGEFVVCRECLMDGPVSSEINDDFWQRRAKFIRSTFDADGESYNSLVVKEFEKLAELNESHNICLWFENDLFCQTNLWFCINFLQEVNAQHVLTRVFPLSRSIDPGWNGFGPLTTEDLLYSYEQRIMLTHDDREWAQKMWRAFASGDEESLIILSANETAAFQEVKEVVNAHIDRRVNFPGEGRPHRALHKIMQEGRNTFPEIFQEFSRREGIYGFGDSQVKKMLEAMDSNTTK